MALVFIYQNCAYDMTDQQLCKPFFVNFIGSKISIGYVAHLSFLCMICLSLITCDPMIVNITGISCVHWGGMVPRWGTIRS